MRVGGLNGFQDSQQCAGLVAVLGDRLIDQQALVIFKTFTGNVVGGACHVPSLPGPGAQTLRRDLPYVSGPSRRRNKMKEKARTVFALQTRPR